MLWYPRYTTFDPAILDVLDWRLGPGKGRLVLLAKYDAAVQPHADHMALRALHDCFHSRYPSPGATLRLEMSEGVVWDGADLTLPGVWPDTLIDGLPGTEITKVVEHPALPRNRPITAVDVTGTGIILRTTRAALMTEDDIRSPTFFGRLRDHVAIEVEAARFVRSHGVHEGFGLLAVLCSILGALGGSLVGLVPLGVLLLLAHLMPFAGDAFEVLAFVALGTCTLAGGIAMFLQEYCSFTSEGLTSIYDISSKAYGRSML